MPIISAGDTHIGMKRQSNQDSIFLDSSSHLYCVADGMGGHNGGDIASQMSVELLPKFIKANKNNFDIETLLDKSIIHVNESLYLHGQKNQELKGMGTTITCITFEDNDIIIANVGDSRAYMVNDKKIYQLTRDHSLVQEKINLGLYGREEARLDNQKNVLIRTVGFEPELEVDVFRHKVTKNDIFILCSDGLHGKVSDEDIIHIVNNHIPHPEAANENSLKLAVQTLIDQANKNGGQDNISVIIALVK